MSVSESSLKKQFPSSSAANDVVGVPQGAVKADILKLGLRRDTTGRKYYYMIIEMQQEQSTIREAYAVKKTLCESVKAALQSGASQFLYLNRVIPSAGGSKSGAYEGEAYPMRGSLLRSPVPAGPPSPQNQILTNDGLL